MSHELQHAEEHVQPDFSSNMQIGDKQSMAAPREARSSYDCIVGPMS
jgi:hypothetical protein